MVLPCALHQQQGETNWMLRWWWLKSEATNISNNNKHGGCSSFLYGTAFRISQQHLQILIFLKVTIACNINLNFHSDNSFSFSFFISLDLVCRLSATRFSISWYRPKRTLEKDWLAIVQTQFRVWWWAFIVFLNRTICKPQSGTWSPPWINMRGRIFHRICTQDEPMHQPRILNQLMWLVFKFSRRQSMLLIPLTMQDWSVHSFDASCIRTRNPTSSRWYSNTTSTFFWQAIHKLYP